MSDKYDELHPDWLETDGIARICYKLVSIIRDEEGQEIGREEGSAYDSMLQQTGRDTGSGN